MAHVDTSSGSGCGTCGYTEVVGVAHVDTSSGSGCGTLEIHAYGSSGCGT